MKVMEVFDPRKDMCRLFSDDDVGHIRIQYANRLFFHNGNKVDRSIVTNYFVKVASFSLFSHSVYFSCSLSELVNLCLSLWYFCSFHFFLQGWLHAQATWKLICFYTQANVTTIMGIGNRPSAMLNKAVLTEAPKSICWKTYDSLSLTFLVYMRCTFFLVTFLFTETKLYCLW
jgi:hypothetical protein